MNDNLARIHYEGTLAQWKEIQMEYLRADGFEDCGDFRSGITLACSACIVGITEDGKVMCYYDTP